MARTWLKEKREKLGLSQTAFAERIHITAAHYNYIENGHRRPSVEVAQKIASALGFPEDWYKLLENNEVSA